MIKEILYKIFNLEPFPCASCETLKQQLSESNAEKRSLLNLVLEINSPKSELVQAKPETNLKPVGSRFIPWEVRRQALEAEDRVKMQVLNQNKIESLEEEILTAPTMAKTNA